MLQCVAGLCAAVRGRLGCCDVCRLGLMHACVRACMQSCSVVHECGSLLRSGRLAISPLLLLMSVQGGEEREGGITIVVDLL